MRRREFIRFLGNAAAGWPLTVRAQQPERMRRVGVLMFQSADDPVAQSNIATLKQALRELGWTEGRNVTIDFRAPGNEDRIRNRYASELVALAPDVIVAGNGGTARVLR